MIAIVGVGGVGSYIAEFLAREKQQLLLIDYDIVKEKNINQRFCKREYIGMKKVEAALKELKDIAEIKTIDKKVEKAIFKADIIVDCTDTLNARKAVLKKAEKMNIPYVFCSSSSFFGITTIVKDYKAFSSLFFNKKAKQERSNAYSLAFLASIATSNILKYLKDDKPIIFPKIIIANIYKNYVKEMRL